MSAFTDLLTRYQPTPGKPRMPKANGQAILDKYRADVAAVKQNNLQVTGEILSLGQEALGSAVDSVGEFAKGVLGDFFGGSSSSPAAGAENAGVEAADPGVGAACAEAAVSEAPAAGAGLGLGDGLLGKGNAGPEVKQLQELLNDQGYDLKTDGIFGPKTEEALKDFQAKQGDKGNQIAVDGVVGPETRGALEKAVAEKKAEDNFNETGEVAGNDKAKRDAAGEDGGVCKASDSAEGLGAVGADKTGEDKGKDAGGTAGGTDHSKADGVEARGGDAMV